MHHHRRPRPKSSSLPVRFRNARYIWLSHRRPNLLSPCMFFFRTRGGGRFAHFFMFLGPPKKQGRCVTAWTTFGHKILLSQTAMSLQSLSLVGTLNEFCLLKSCLQSVFSATAKKCTLPRQATVLAPPSFVFGGGSPPLGPRPVHAVRARRTVHAARNT